MPKPLWAFSDGCPQQQNQAKKMAAAALAGCGSKSGGEPLTKEVRRLAFVEAYVR